MDPEKNGEAVAPEESELRQIRTFQGDIAEALQKQDTSLVSIQRKEHAKYGPPKPRDDVTAKRRSQLFSLTLGSLLLIVLGAAGAWFAYTEFQRKAVSPITASLANRFVSASAEANIDTTSLDRAGLINALASIAQSTTPGEITHVVMRKTGAVGTHLLSTEEFLEILRSEAPGSLVRAFDDLFMFGSLGTASGNASRFIIVKLTSFENAFGGMLSWEKTIAKDIGAIFTTAPALANLPPEAAFADITDRNKDIRALSSAEGRPLLLYSFFDSDLLIITENLETARTLIERLTRERLSR